MKTLMLVLLILLVLSLNAQAQSIVLHKGMSRAQVLELMGEPVKVKSQYLTDDGGVYEHRQFMFSSEKCSRGRDSICSVVINSDDRVIGWLDVKSLYTEEGR